MCVLLDHRSLTCSSTAAGRLLTAHPLKARSHQFEERIGAKSTVVFTISATAEYFLFVNVFFRVDRLSNVHCTYCTLYAYHVDSQVIKSIAGVYLLDLKF